MRPFSIFLFAFIAFLAAALSLSFAATAPQGSPAEPMAPGNQCALSPAKIDAGFNAQTPVVPSCTSDGEEVPCPGLSWNTTIGSISGGPFSVTHNSGTTAGTGTLSASGPGFSCSIPVSVHASSPASGGCAESQTAAGRTPRPARLRRPASSATP